MKLRQLEGLLGGLTQFSSVSSLLRPSSPSSSPRGRAVAATLVPLLSCVLRRRPAQDPFLHWRRAASGTGSVPPLAAGGVRHGRLGMVVAVGFGDRMRARAPISLFLLPIAGAAIDQIFTTSDEVAAPGTETVLEFSDHVRSFVNPVWTSLSGNDLNTTSATGKQLHISHEKLRRPSRSFPPAIHLERHPCENLSFSPPPIDRKCTGPWPSPILQCLNYLSEDNLVLKESNSVSLFGGYHPWNNEMRLMT